MALFDFHKVIIKPAEKSWKTISVLNPLAIRRKGTRTKAIFALALVCFFWGTTWIASKEGVRYMPPLQMAGLRQLAGGLCYVLFFLIKGERWPQRKEWRSIIILSILNFLMANGLSSWGLKYISAGLGSIIGAIFPLWLVVIGLFSAKTKMAGKAILGLLLGFSGVCIIFYEHLQDFFIADFRIGILLSLTATWGWAFGTIYTKSHAARFNPYFSIGLQMVISGLALTGISYTTTEPIAFNIYTLAVVGRNWIPRCIWFCDFIYSLFICIAKSFYGAGFFICLCKSNGGRTAWLAYLFRKPDSVYCNRRVGNIVGCLPCE